MSFLTRIFGSEIKVEDNMPFVINFMDGPVILREQTPIEYTESGLIKTTCYARSYRKPNPDKDKNYEEYIKKMNTPIPMLIEKGCRHSFAVGELDPEIDIVFYMPNITTEINPRLQSTNFFKFLHPILAENHMLKDGIEVVSKSLNELKQIILQFGTGEITEASLKRVNDIILSIQKTTQEIKEHSEKTKEEKK